MLLLLFVLKPLLFRWGCKNWHTTELFHPVPVGVSSPGLQHRESVQREHQWQSLAAPPTEEQTGLWEIGSSALCPALLPTHRRLGNAGGKWASSNFFPMTDILYKAGAGHKWYQPKRSPDGPGSAKRLLSWAALNPFISSGCPENIYISITAPCKVLLPNLNFLYVLTTLA